MSRRVHLVDPRLLDFAKKLRNGQAPAEQILWECLRNLRLKFRRQTPIGRNVADFYCAECGLVVELDGKTHDGRLAADDDRTLALNERGCVVVRYLNSEVYDDLERVLTDLATHCENGRTS